MAGEDKARRLISGFSTKTLPFTTHVINIWQRNNAFAALKGEKRPADVQIGNAVKVMRIATGEETDELPDDSEGKDPAAKRCWSRSAPIGEP